ncbi:MAG TPA: hypothetical protein VGV15_10770 [Terriglobales bacterium]|nr:hypothetical protein [Terriglobales bacterium]
MKLMPGQRVIWQRNGHGTVLKRVKRNPAVCYVRADGGKVKVFLERELRPEPVTINLASPLYVRGRRKHGKCSPLRASRPSAALGFAHFVSGGRVESKR